MSEQLRTFGLLGTDIQYSSSPAFFHEKFASLDLPYRYELIDIDALEEDLRQSLADYSGLNVTIPFKQAIFPFLDDISLEASKIGAVNCIEVKAGKWIGHNTDAFGFRESIRPFLKSYHRKALILGSGGASKAVAYVLESLGIEYLVVSRTPSGDQIGYEDLNENAVRFFPFIINTTPVGSANDEQGLSRIPYQALSQENFCYDLIYTPEQTMFMKKAAERGAQILGGMPMLKAQAERSWEIWRNAIS